VGRLRFAQRLAQHPVFVIAQASFAFAIGEQHHAMHRIVGPHPAPHRIGEDRAQEPYDPVGRPLATANARKAALLRRFGPTCRLTGRNIV
jgi:hypothetical protein